MFDKRMTQIAAITAQGAHYYNKGDGKAFLTWLCRQPQRTVYALNIQYDLGNLFGKKRLDQMDCTLVGGRMIKVEWGGKIFVDVFNLWLQGVKKLGEVFGLKKLDFDEHSKAYVFRDVEIIREAMLYVWRFAANLGMDNVPPTLGSLGVKLWKLWGGESVHCSDEIARDAIFGGRVELFKTCNDNMYNWLHKQGHTRDSSKLILAPEDLPSDVAYADLNSLYPSQMCKAFPGILEDTGKKLKAYGVAQVTMHVPKCEIATLPYRNDEGKIYFPYGDFTGVWTIAEIQAAERNGATIKKVHNVLSTDEAIYPYKTYMERIYKIRLGSVSKVEKYFYKLLMNTLYGRTGSTGKLGRTVMLNEHNAESGVKYGERVLTSYMMPLGDEVNWAHAAYTTAYGRLELLDHLNIVGAKKLIYCDTDSVIFDCPDKIIPFEISDKLGKMKLESWESICIPYAPKMYRLGNDYKAKGVPKDKQIEFIQNGFVNYDIPFKFREAVRFYDRGNSKQLSVWREIEKHNNANYDKKILKENRYFPCKIIDI